MSGSAMPFILIAAFIAIFYFMMFRPQQKQRKEHQAMLASLKKGDHVMTAAGVYGKVKRVDDSLIELEIARGVTIKIARNAVTQIIRDKRAARAVAPGPRGRHGRQEPDDEPDVDEIAAEAEESEESEEEVEAEEGGDDDGQESEAEAEGEEYEDDSEEAEDESEIAEDDDEEAEIEDDVQQSKRRKRRR